MFYQLPEFSDARENVTVSVSSLNSSKSQENASELDSESDSAECVYLNSTYEIKFTNFTESRVENCNITLTNLWGMSSYTNLTFDIKVYKDQAAQVDNSSD